MMHDATSATIVTFTNVLDWIGKSRCYIVTLGGLLSVFLLCETGLFPLLQRPLRPRPLKIELERGPSVLFLTHSLGQPQKERRSFHTLTKIGRQRRCLLKMGRRI